MVLKSGIWEVGWSQPWPWLWKMGHFQLWKTHLLFCKHIFEVNIRILNPLSLGDLGRYPFKIMIDVKIIELIPHVKSLSVSTLVHHVLIQDRNLSNKKEEEKIIKDISVKKLSKKRQLVCNLTNCSRAVLNYLVQCLVLALGGGGGGGRGGHFKTWFVRGCVAALLENWPILRLKSVHR